MQPKIIKSSLALTTLAFAGWAVLAGFAPPQAAQTEVVSIDVSKPGPRYRRT